MDDKFRSPRPKKSSAAGASKDWPSPPSSPERRSSPKSLPSSKSSPSLKSPSLNSLSSPKSASFSKLASPRKSGTAAGDKLPRSKSSKQFSNAETFDVISVPPSQRLPPPNPVQLPLDAVIKQTKPCLDLGNYSTNTGIVPATDVQLHDVTRFCNGIGHWLYLLQLIISVTDTTDLFFSMKTSAIPILMEYDTGNMWYLDVLGISFDEISQQVKFSQPECEVYNLNRKPDGQKKLGKERKELAAGKKNKSKPPEYTDTVYTFKLSIKIPSADGMIDYKIRDPKNGRYGEQSTGDFDVTFEDLRIDIRLGITETPEGNKNRYHSPVFELDYQLEDIMIKSHYFPSPTEKGGTLPCTESTMEQLLADLKRKIFRFKKEMADRLRASVIKKLKPKLDKMNSMIDAVNIFLPYIHKELIEHEEWLEKHLNDPKLTKVQLEFVKMLIFILEDSPKIRYMIQHIMVKKQEKGMRILIPFILEEEQLEELDTIEELNEIDVTNFDERNEETIKNFKKVLDRETPKSSVSEPESDRDKDTDDE